MGFKKTNYSSEENRVDDSAFLEKALVKAVVSGGSIVVFLPKSGRKLVI